MSNTFVESMWRGLQLGHQQESERRLNQAAQQQAQILQMQAQEHQMKMASMAQQLLQQEETKKAASDPKGVFKDLPPVLRGYIQSTGTIPAQAWSLLTPEKPVSVSPGASLVKPSTGETVYTAPAKPTRPVSVSPGASLVDPDTGETRFTAPSTPERPVSVAPGSTLVKPSTGEAIYTAPPKPEDENKNQTEVQLTARALKGDREAKSILDAIEARRVTRETRVSDLIESRNATRYNLSQDKSDRLFATTLRKEFNNLPEVKEYNQTVPKISSMKAAYETSKKTGNFVAVDQALITLFNKLTDPQSVVRESEYARTAQNIPLLNVIAGKAQKVLSGGAGLTADERKALMEMAMLMQKGYADIRNKRLNEYRTYGKDAGLKRDFLIDATGTSGPQRVGRFIVESE